VGSPGLRDLLRGLCEHALSGGLTTGVF
jgi:hypothetical protein